MKIFIAGGTGFLGRILSRRLLEAGHSITLLSRRPRTSANLPANVAIVEGNPLIPGPWQKSVAGHDVVINFIGFNIFTRWTERAKRLILESRIKSTQNLVDCLPSEEGSPITFMNASASGYYGFKEVTERTEESGPGNDFLADVCVQWEAEALRAGARARVILLRTGIVLEPHGGALAKMLPGFRLGVAGHLGNGGQWFPWIHISDYMNAILFLLDNATVSGAVNMSAPHPVTNRQFTKTLGRVLNRPTVLPVPAFAVRILFGEMASVILEGTKMMPAKLMENGFLFQYPDLEGALRNLLHKKE